MAPDPLVPLLASTGQCLLFPGPVPAFPRSMFFMFFMCLIFFRFNEKTLAELYLFMRLHARGTSQARGTSRAEQYIASIVGRTSKGLHRPLCGRYRRHQVPRAWLAVHGWTHTSTRARLPACMHVHVRI